MIQKIREKIKEELVLIEKQQEEKRKNRVANRQASIATIRFIIETINNIGPTKITAKVSGSYDNSEDGNYPEADIQAVHILTNTTLAAWHIDSSGRYPAPEITEKDITAEVLKGLKRMTSRR